MITPLELFISRTPVVASAVASRVGHVSTRSHTFELPFLFCLRLVPDSVAAFLIHQYFSIWALMTGADGRVVLQLGRPSLGVFALACQPIGVHTLGVGSFCPQSFYGHLLPWCISPRRTLFGARPPGVRFLVPFCGFCRIGTRAFVIH